MRPAIRGGSSALSTLSIPRRQIPLTFRSRPSYLQPYSVPLPIRAFSHTHRILQDTSAEKRARELNEKSLAEHEDGYKGNLDNVIGKERELQVRTPWHREGSDRPPVKRMRSASAMTKGTYIPLKFTTP